MSGDIARYLGIFVAKVPDDDRKRRRLGDATKSRIAELADGWTVDPANQDDDDAEDEASEAPARPAPRTQPPPPPGSSERMSLDDILIIESSGDTPLPAPRPKPPSVPPPIPPPRKPTHQVQTLNAKSGPADVQNASASGMIEEPNRPSQGFIDPTKNIVVSDLVEKSPAPIFDRSKINAGKAGVPKLDLGASASRPVFPLPADTPARAPSPPVPIPKSRPPSPPPPRPTTADELTIPELGPPSAQLAVPVGEFDTSAATTIEEGKFRIAHQQATIVRDATDALLNIASSASMRTDGTAVDGSTNRFERGDPTTIDGAKHDSSDVSAVGMTQSMATLRTAPALRRKRGLGGDVRYVFTAMMGVREFRRELVQLEARQATRQTSRRHHLLTLGRTAVVVETYDHPALTKAREELDSVEDQRARNAGLVTAADLELDRVRRDREAAAKQFVVDATATDAELAELAKKLEPLEKEAAAVRKRVTELQESLKRIDKKIANTEASLDAPKPKQDRAAIQADIATLKADRVAIKRDEPIIAGELDALAPRIASLQASRTDAERRRRELDKAELDDQRRSDELMAAIGAKRKVVDRATAEAEAERDKILFELGDRLYVDRPRSLRPQLAPIEDIDLELGTGDRRIMELRELIGSVDKAKLARGIAVIALAALAFIGLVTLIVVKVV